MVKKTGTILLALLLFLLPACGNEIKENPNDSLAAGEAGQISYANTENEVETLNGEDDLMSRDENTEEIVTVDKKEIIVYFPNWKLSAQNGKVSDIPWDTVTMINHAFWKIKPLESEETSFERRDKGLPARTEFTIVSTNPDSDAIIFSEYEKYHEKYPDTRIMISIGGWCACGYFSEMSYTEEGRESFANACVDLISQYDWIGGIDIDWEYPGGAAWGERGPEGTYNEGCPIFGKQYEDRKNFPLMLKTLKEALDTKFGAGTKLVTACAGAPLTVIKYQNWGEASEYLDYINVMSYDLVNENDGVAGHASSLSGAKSAVNYLISDSVDKSIINIGAPFYGTGFYITGDIDSENIIGTAINQKDIISKEMLTESYIDEIRLKCVDEGIKGWHEGYDDKAGGAFLYNDNPECDQYGWFISFDNEKALKDKTDYITERNLAGIIVWEITQDTADNKYIDVLASMNE